MSHLAVLGVLAAVWIIGRINWWLICWSARKHADAMMEARKDSEQKGGA